MTKLETINAEDLQNRTYEPTPFLVDELIPEGLHILAGAPKIGKSWLALWLCLCVSQGQPLWNFAVTQGEALYLSLEDSFQRIQTRLFDLTEDAPPTLRSGMSRPVQCSEAMLARRELFWRTKVESAAPLKPVEPEIMFIGSSSWSFRR